MRHALGIAALIALAAASGEALAEPSYATANQAYDRGDHADAIRQYETLLRGGVRHEHLYYNLANAYFRDGQLGKAIYNYERALAIEPGFADAQHNLELARAAVSRRVEHRIEGADGRGWHSFADGVLETLLLRAASLLDLGTVTLLLLLFDVLFFGGLIAARFSRRRRVRSALRISNVCSGVGLLLTAVLFAGHLYLRDKVQMAIVLPDELRLHERAAADSPDRGMVHAGMRVRVIGAEGHWLRVRLANGMEGWVEKAGAGQL